MPQMTASPQHFAMPQMAQQPQVTQMPQHQGVNQNGAGGPPVASPQQQSLAQPGAAPANVSYLSPQDSIRWAQGQRSFGYQPLTPQAPLPPAVR
jgi:hypothetical protein